MAKPELQIERAGNGFAVNPPPTAPYHARQFRDHRDACTYAALMARAFGWRWRDRSNVVPRHRLFAFKALADASAALLSREACHSAAQSMGGEAEQ